MLCLLLSCRYTSCATASMSRATAALRSPICDSATATSVRSCGCGGNEGLGLSSTANSSLDIASMKSGSTLLVALGWPGCSSGSACCTFASSLCRCCRSFRAAKPQSREIRSCRPQQCCQGQQLPLACEQTRSAELNGAGSKRSTAGWQALDSSVVAFVCRPCCRPCCRQLTLLSTFAMPAPAAVPDVATARRYCCTTASACWCSVA
jgi:hypothetical protein